MKQLYLKTLVFLLMCMVGANAFAYDCVVDGIYYNLNKEEMTAKVTNNGFNSYSGDIVIPFEISFSGAMLPTSRLTTNRSSSDENTYSVTSIGGSAFSGCTGLTSITIPESVTSIGDWAFADCSDLTSITIPESVITIGKNAFSGCSGLTSITIPNSVTSIRDYAFQNCTGLTNITIPNSVTSIGKSAFFSCTGLTKVIVPDIAAWCAISFAGYASNPLYYAKHLYSDENTEIKDLVIPNSVTSIEEGAFYGCTGLTSVTIGNSVTSIGDRAFHSCSGLTSITIPNSVTSIGKSAFFSCTCLTNVTVLAETPAEISSGTFSNRQNATLYVPAGCKTAYETADYWKEFKEIIEMEVEQADVETVQTSNNAINSNNTTVYDLQGRKVAGIGSGLNIIRMSDGTVRKVVVK